MFGAFRGSLAGLAGNSNGSGLKSKFMQKNGAPTGYGQQDGASLFLDKSQDVNHGMQFAEDGEDPMERKRREAAALVAQGQQPSGDPVNNAMQALLGQGRPVPQQQPVSAGAAGPDPSQGYQGAAPSFHQAMSMGFPTNRDYNTTKSAKDAFAVLSNAEGVPAAPLQDKKALGAWFNQYVAPGMEDQGHHIESADGDKFRFSNHQGTFDVDFGRGAGAEGGALDWMADDVNAPQVQAEGSPMMSMGNNDAILQALLSGEGMQGDGDLNKLLELLMSGQNPF